MKKKGRGLVITDIKNHEMQLQIKAVSKDVRLLVQKKMQERQAIIDEINSYTKGKKITISNFLT